MHKAKESGYFGIGIYYPKRDFNIGTLWRTAVNFNASFIFTIGKKYKKQTSDVFNAYSKIPMYHYDDAEAFFSNVPRDCQIIGLEQNDISKSLIDFKHPKRAIYLIGAEDVGLQEGIVNKCQHVIEIPSDGSLNVAVSGAVVLYDRLSKVDR